jgi:hypothetical protein
MNDSGKPALFGSSMFLIHKTVLLGTVFLWLWVGLGLLLAPIYGWHLWAMGEIITERATLLQSSGQTAHPILSLYTQLSSWDIGKAGALLGMMFLAWPWALALAIQETLASAISATWARFTLRTGTLTLISFWLWPELEPFLWEHWMWGYTISILVFFPPLLTWMLASVAGTKIQLTRARRYLACALVFGFVLALGSHPVWSLWTHPEQSAGLNKIPLIRDFLLLDEQGNDWVNEWYYGSSPLLMERERVTSFQPMMVGFFGVKLDSWRPLFIYCFREHDPRFRRDISFLPLELDDDPEVLMRRGVIDYLALAPAFRNHLKTWDLPKGSYGVYHEGLRSLDPYFVANGDQAPFEYDRQNYYQKVGKYTESPLTIRFKPLQKMGFFPDMMKAFQSSKLRFFKVMKEGKGVWAFATLILLGMAATLIISLQWLIRIRFLWVLVILWLGSMSWLDRYQFWVHEVAHAPHSDQQTIWTTLIQWHQRAIAKNKSDIENLLTSDFSEDSRIFMLQVSVLGRGFETLDQDQKKLAQKEIDHVLLKYHDSSLNVRYKMIDAFAHLAACRIPLKVLLRDERHPYVHWYAADRGIRAK